MKIYNYNLLYLFTCFPKFNLKSDNDLQFTNSAGSEFHSVIDLGKKENLKTSLDTSYMCNFTIIINTEVISLHRELASLHSM